MLLHARRKMAVVVSHSLIHRRFSLHFLLQFGLGEAFALPQPMAQTRSFFHIQTRNKKRLKTEPSLFYHTYPRRKREFLPAEMQKSNPASRQPAQSSQRKPHDEENGDSEHNLSRIPHGSSKTS
ncbi:hypothetical protein [Pyramidobacter sp. CG50-2]|uniref:hypothetical protein n=1 Tax=Pyramidobacter sp. CG50-2 TaxID=2382160 RepID=UPI0018F604AA|nr:hypothetical protein [Pyramidobacter sp. CG50-2]